MPLVYEARNETLKELFIGLTELPLNKLEARHKGGLPAAIAHWKPEAHRIIYQEVEPDLSDAMAFVKGYAQNMEKNGWKSITE